VRLERRGRAGYDKAEAPMGGITKEMYKFLAAILALCATTSGTTW
jgi:hypothetical protein